MLTALNRFTKLDILFALPFIAREPFQSYCVELNGFAKFSMYLSVCRQHDRLHAMNVLLLSSLMDE